MTSAISRRHFADFCFDPISGELSRDGRAVPLEYQPSVILSRLLDAGGALVSRGELAAALWGDETHVNFDDGLNYCIRQIRAALEDDARTPRFIETVPRRGYRFIAPVIEGSSKPAQRWRSHLAPALAVAIVILTVVVESRPNNHHEVAVAVARTLHDLIF
jgi:DNA-binding winged helix-turn-helix (wHTH) protein